MKAPLHPRPFSRLLQPPSLGRVLRRSGALLLALSFALDNPIATTTAVAQVAERTFVLAGQSVPFRDVSALVEVNYGGMRWNRSKNSWQVEVTLRNTGNLPITGRLLLAVMDSTGASNLPDADNASPVPPGEPAFWNLTAWRDGGTLASGGRTRPRLVAIGRQGNEAPRLVTRVFAETQRSGGSALALTLTLDDHGLPLTEVTVEESGPSGFRTFTSDRGLGAVTLGGPPGAYQWRFLKDGFHPAWRIADLTDGVIRLPFPRLTQRRPTILTLNSSANTHLLADDLSIEILPGTTTATRAAHVTRIHPQSPPLPIPPGWSPEHLLWLEWEGTLARPLRVNTLPRREFPAGQTFTVIQFDATQPAWRVLDRRQPAPGEWVVFEVNSPGAYGVVVADGPPTAPSSPQPGALLAEAVPVPLPSPDDLAITGRVMPPVSLASTNPVDVTAEARWFVETREATLPSGTVLPATISERYKLPDGSLHQPPPWDTFITLFREASDTNAHRATAETLLRPRRLLRESELTEAVVEASIPSVRRTAPHTLGEGLGPVRWEGLEFFAPPGSSQDVRVIDLAPWSEVGAGGSPSSVPSELTGLFPESAGLPGFLGSSGNGPEFAPIAAFALTAGFNQPADRLGFRFEQTPSPGAYVLGRAWYHHADAGLEPVARYSSDSGAWVSVESDSNPDLPGIDRSGQYVVIRVPQPVGVVSGIARDALGEPLPAARVWLEGQPWSVLTSADGRFTLASPRGAGAVLLRSPSDGGLRRAAFNLPASMRLEDVDVSLAPAPPFVDGIQPLAGAEQVDVLATVEVQFSQPVSPPAGSPGIVLRDAQSNAVPARVTFATDRHSARLVPLDALAEGAAYRVVVDPAIANSAGRTLVGSLESRFTTLSNSVARSVGAQLFSTPPDPQGLVRVIGTAGMAPARLPVLFVNDTTGQTTTLLANADGSFTNTIPASVTDRLRIVLLNPGGARTEIPVGRQVFPDGSVALYAEGGRIAARNDALAVVLEVPPGAILGRTRFKLEPHLPEDIPALTRDTPPEEATAFAAFDLEVEGDPVRGRLRVEVQPEGIPLEPPPGKTRDDFVLYAAAFRDLQDAGASGDATTPVYAYQSLLKPIESSTSPPPLGGARSRHALFAGYYALIDPVGARMLLFGSVYYANTEVFGKTASALFAGGRAAIQGSEVRIGGAVVRARAGSQANSRPFSLQGGEIVVISEADGNFAFLVPEQGASGGHSLIATHPAFPRQFATGTAVRVDPLYPNAVSTVLFDRGRLPDDAPPSISISHSPAQPPAGTDAVVRVEAIDDGGPATVTVRVDHTEPATAVASAVSRSRGAWEVRSSTRSKVVLSVRAEDSTGNSAEQAYVLLFGEPPVPPRPPNDPVGPYVVFSDPDEGSVGTSPLQPVALHFNEWIDPQNLQSPSTYFTLTPRAGPITAAFEGSPQQVRLSFGGLRDDTEYTLTIQGLRDLGGQIFDQNPATNSPPAEPFQLRFRTAPNLSATLPNIDEGGGAVLLGSYAYLIDRRGSKLNRYDVSIPSQPRLVGERSLPGPPRALTLIRDYEFTLDFATPGVPSDQPGPRRKSDLLVVAGKTSGVQLGYLRVYDLNQDFPASPAIAGSSLSLDETAQFGRLTWSAPYLLLAENNFVSPQVHALNFQSVLLADAYRALSRNSLRSLPDYSDPGLDANNDGDFVDPGDRLPTVGRDAINFVAGEIDVLSLDPNRSGPNGRYQLRESGRFITDAVLHGPSGHAVVLTAPGRDVLVQIRGYPVETNILFRATTARSYLIRQSSPDTLVPNVVSNAFGLEFPGWYPKRGLLIDHGVQRLLLLNLIALDNSANSLRVIDVSRADSLVELAEIPFPIDEYGLVQGAELDARGRIVLSTAGPQSEDLILLDPTRLLLPSPTTGPHPAILGRMGGIGTGVTPFAVGSQGVSVGSLRSRNLVGQGPPHVRFLPAGTNTFEAVQLNDPEERLAQLRLLPDPAGLPVAGQSTQAALPPDNPAFTWYLMVETPGGAGRQIQLALLSLDTVGHPFPGTNTLLASTVPAIPLRRLSDDPHLDSFNAFVSGPIVLMADSAAHSEIQRLAGRVQLLRAGSRVRVGIPESMRANPVLGPFAGSGTPLASPPPNSPPVRLGASQSRPVTVVTPSLTVEDPIVIRTTVDRINQRACPGSGWLYFENSLDADVSITIDGQPLRNAYDENGNLVGEFTGVATVAGRHRILIDAARVPEPGAHPVEVTATRFAGLAPNLTLAASATIQHEIELNQTFPVGHTIIQGVDLWDGHLGHSAQDATVPGRRLALTFGRTYSSAGDSSAGPLGAGWTHSYNVRLIHNIPCGVFTVVGGEGSGNAFDRPQPDPARAARYLPLLPAGTDPANLEFFSPQIGHHSVLIRDRTQPDRFWFLTKEALRHDFVAEASLANSSREVFTLRAIRDPSGNALTLDYLDGDSDPATLDSVTERDALGQLPKRAFHFEYARIAGESRIHTLRGFNHQGSRDLLELEIHYAYDDDGNLVRVTRLGATPETTRVERYRYSLGNGPTGHNLVETIGPNGAITRYQYAATNLAAGAYYAANGNLLPDVPPHEIVTHVTHVGAARPGFEATADASYGFRFDFANSRRHVTDPRGTDSDGNPIPDTEYTLNTYGATVRVRAPLGQESEMRWATDHLDGSVRDAANQPVHDVLMTWRRDPEGQEQFFEYHDGRGNLTAERTAFAGSTKRPVTDALGNPVTEVIRRHAYDSVFNQRTNTVDAEGGVTRHIIDPRTGNLLRTVDAEGHTTRFSYRPDGDLHDQTDTRGFTTSFLDYDPYGNPRRIRDPIGNETVTDYNERGFATDSRDAFGHHSRSIHDSLDRKVAELRLNDLSGASSNPSMITGSRYDAAGLLLESTNALGSVTRHFYDALNRRVRSEQRDVPQAQGARETYVTRVAYDRAGNLVAETDARGVIRRHAYDALNRRIRTTLDGPFGGPSNGTGILAHLAYDRAGNLTNEVDLHGFATSHIHDALYRIVESHLPYPGSILTTRYDREGNKTRITDADGHATHLEYDRLHRLRRSTNAEGHVSEFEYDPAGNRTNSVDRASGLVTRVQYDALNREIRHTFDGPGLPPDGLSTTTVYDDSLNQVTVTNPRGFSTRIRKDGLDRVVESTVDPGGLDLVTRQTHDPLGNVLELIDPEGGDTDQVQEFDTLGRLIRRSFVRTPDDPTGITETFQYDPEGNLVGTVDRRGIEKRLGYDNLGRPVRIEIREPISGGGAWRTLASTRYDDDANEVVQTDGRGNTSTTRMDELGRIRDTTDALGGTATTVHGSLDVLARTDPRGHRSTFAYDALHRLRSQTDFDTNGTARTTSAIAYVDAERRVQATDRRGLVSTAHYDALGRAIRIERSGPDLAARYGANPLVLERREYDGNGNLVRRIDGGGAVTEITFDAADRPTHVTLGAGSAVAATTVTRYDRVGNVVSVKDPRNHGGTFDVRHTYDARYRRVATENALGEITRFRYDAANQLTELIDPLGHVTRYSYDELGALLAVDETPRATSGDAGITRFRYDGNGNLTAQQDPSGNLVTRSHDALNRVTNLLQHTLPGTLGPAVSRTGPHGGGAPLVWSFTYDPNGNRTGVRDPRGQRTRLDHDHLNRLVRRDYSDHAEVSAPGTPLIHQPIAIHYVYDGNDNPIEVTEEKQGPSGVLIERTRLDYDGLDRLVARRRFDHDDPVGRSLSFDYDIVGNRTNLVDADGRITATEFDPRHRLAAVRLDPAGPSPLRTTFTWEPDDLLSRVDFPGGTSAQRTYDAGDRLLSITNLAGSASVPHSVFAYAYDAAGNRVSQTERQPGASFGVETTVYGYDRLNRLTTVAYGSAGGLTNTYAPNGNRLTERGIDPVSGNAVDRAYRYERIANRPATTFDGVNVLTRIDDLIHPARSIDYEYDSNLNQTARIQDGDRREFRFDVRDQMISARIAGATTRFDYNADRLRAKKITDAGHETRYLYDQSAVILEYGDAGSAHATLRKYDYGNALLALGTPTTGGTTTLDRAFYLTDGLKNTVNLVDPTGTLVERYRYDAWGRIRAQQGGHENPRLHTGHYRDSETGLHYFGARYYDEEQARFTSADPYLGDPRTPPSLHRYLYAYANPLRFSDPTGFESESGDPADRWIQEARATLREIDQSHEADIAALGPGSLETYRDGRKAAETLQRMDEERQRMLQEAGLTEADLRNPVLADRARWGLALFKRDLMEWSVDGDAGTWRAVAAGVAYATAQVVLAPFELGAGAGTVAGKLDVGAEITAGEWIAAGADALAVAGALGKAGKIGLTEIAEHAAKSSANRSLRGAVIGEARRTLGREVGSAAKWIDEAPKRLAAEREWHQISRHVDESMREAALLRRASTRLAGAEPHAYREAAAQVGRLRSSNLVDRELADFYVNQMLRDHGRRLARIDELTRDVVRNAGQRNFDDTLRRLSSESPFEIRRAADLPADLPGFGRSPYTGQGRGGYNPVRFSESEGKLFADADLIRAARGGDETAARRFAGEFLHDSAAVPQLTRYGKSNTPVVVFENVIQVPGRGFRPLGQHMTHYFDEALDRYLRAYRALHPGTP
ncbi:MAG: Ig-like domain-containing protein [Limisphaerales bacterium]